MRRYLLVDDNVPFAENIAEILRDEGDDAVVAQSGNAALTALRGGRYDAMVTDMRMPEMGGAKLVQQLRRLDPGLPVIVVTAYSGDEDLKVARAEGLLAILPKPPPLGELQQLLSVARRDALVALVEDDHALADNLCEVLRTAGMTVVTAATIVETERLGDVRPFAAIADMRVPGGGDGAAVAALQTRYPGIKVLGITGHPDAAVPPQVDALYRKPFAPAELLATLERMHRATERSS